MRPLPAPPPPARPRRLRPSTAGLTRPAEASPLVLTRHSLTRAHWGSRSPADASRAGRPPLVQHIVKYSLSTKQGWEISSTLHSYYKVLMQTDVTVNSSETAPAAPYARKSTAQITYEAESDSGSDEEKRRLASGGKEQDGGGSAAGRHQKRPPPPRLRTAPPRPPWTIRRAWWGAPTHPGAPPRQLGACRGLRSSRLPAAPKPSACPAFGGCQAR